MLSVFAVNVFCALPALHVLRRTNFVSAVKKHTHHTPLRRFTFHSKQWFMDTRRPLL